MKSHHFVSEGVGGIPTETLKNVFVGVMAVVFAIEVGGHFLGWFGYGLAGAINFLQILVLTEVPLWFAQVLLWSRGEDIFQKWEPELNRTVKTLENLGVTVDLVVPFVLELRDEMSSWTDEERNRLVLALRLGLRDRLHHYRARLKEVGDGASKTEP